jgi:hypothetical protein
MRPWLALLPQRPRRPAPITRPWPTATTAATANALANTDAAGAERHLAINSASSGSITTAGRVSGSALSGDISVNNATVNGNLWVKGPIVSVESTTVNFGVQQINHGPTTVALTIRPSVESEGLSSIRSTGSERHDRRSRSRTSADGGTLCLATVPGRFETLRRPQPVPLQRRLLHYHGDNHGNAAT